MKQRRIPVLLLVPLGLLTRLLISGTVVCVIQSLGIMPALGLTNPTLSYYKDLLAGTVGASSGSLMKSLGISLYIAFASAILSTLIGTFLSWSLIVCKKAKGNFKKVITIPIMLPHLIVALFTIFLFSQSGIISRLCFALGIIPGQESFPAFLYSGNCIGIILAFLWKGIPFVCFFVLPAMSGIDCSMYEAAYSMGATKIELFWYITWPLCLPSILGAFFVLLAFNFGSYELPFLLGATAPKALPVQAYIEYSYPDLLHRPYAMAMNSIMLAVSLLFALLWRRADVLAQKQAGGDIA